MAVAYASHSSTAATNSNSVVITKPSGLSAGDLMVAHIGKNATGTNTITTLSGWTSLINDTSGNLRVHIQYKIADSSDASATNFTFTGTGTDPFTGGAIYRITGYGASIVTDGSGSGAWSGTSADLAIGFTPTRASDLYLILVGYASSSANSNISSYAIATSNPSWTEDYDVAFTGGSDLTRLSGAHATRPEVTATGNISFSSSQSANSGFAAIVAIANSLSTTVTAVPGALTLTGGTIAIKTGVKVIATAGSLLLTGGTHIIRKVLNWTNTDKGTSTWTNTDK